MVADISVCTDILAGAGLRVTLGRTPSARQGVPVLLSGAAAGGASPLLWRTKMENMIAKLLDDFDRGRMTRRQLIQSLAVVAAAAAGATPASGENSKGFKAVAVNHISYRGERLREDARLLCGLLGHEGSWGIQASSAT